MDGTGGVNLGDLDGKLNGATYIALDVSAGKMYVTNWWNSSGVVRANLDGTGGENLGDLNGTLNNSLGIALDVAAGKMYVVSYTNNTVSRANLDSTGGVSLGTLNGYLNGPAGIALDIAAGKMYVTNNGNNTVSRANLDGTGGENLGDFNGNLDYPEGIALLFPVAIYVSSDALCNGYNPCSNNIQNGISYASAPSIIKITQETYTENIILDFNRVTILQGGWDTNFTSNPSSTTIDGSITITNGTMIIENIILE